MSIEVEISNLISLIEEELKVAVDGDYSYQKKIIESINYSLFTGGKRLRPIMLLKTFSMYSDDINIAMPFALAVEMIHTYSLVHDDLPSMDDDDYRRGKLTNHKVFGEAIAILTGDALLNLAFETMSKAILTYSKTIEDYKKNTLAMNEIGKCSGVHGMIGGQVVDLLGSQENMEEDKLLFMYQLKTAALIQCSIVSGAILAGARGEDVETLREFGLKLGLAYQIRDDLLDMEEDHIIQKTTYISEFNKHKAKQEVMDLSEDALRLLDSLEGRDTSFLKKLTQDLIYRQI